MGQDTPPFPDLNCSYFSVGILFTNAIRRKLRFLNLDPVNKALSPSALKQEAPSSPVLEHKRCVYFCSFAKALLEANFRSVKAFYGCRLL